EKIGVATITNHVSFLPIYEVMYKYYFGAQRFNDAEQVLIKKVEQNSTKAEPILELAGHYRIMRKPDAMNSVLLKLSSRLDLFPAAYFQVGDFLAVAKDPEGAIHAYEEGVRKEPKKRIEYKKRVIEVLKTQGKRDEAMKMIDSLLLEFPRDRDLRFGK